MKKFAALVAVAVLAMVLAGCASSASSSAASGSSSAGSSEAASTSGESSTASSSEASVGMPNPWSDAATAQEAGEGAGFADGFTVPDQLPVGDIEWIDVTYKYMTGMAQADYEAGAVAGCVRKGQGVSGQEFTGDYNVYEHTWTVEADGIEVTCSGHEEGKTNLGEWSADGYSYAVYMEGLGGENVGVTDAEMVNVVASVK